MGLCFPVRPVQCAFDGVAPGGGLRSREATLVRPTTIAIHDDGDVLRCLEGSLLAFTAYLSVQERADKTICALGGKGRSALKGEL